MNDLATRLREALRDEEDERLSTDAAAAMRRLVVAAARNGEKESARPWFQPLALAATVVVMVAIGIALGQRFDVGSSVDSSDPTRNSPARETPARARQLQFSTPGGTRIIWIFNSDLDLKTTP